MSVFFWDARVYWEDTDGGGIVYYANYLRYLERARTEWLRSLGFHQHAFAAETGLVFIVTHVNIDYRRPARLDDALRITCEPFAEGRATLAFKQKIFREPWDASDTSGEVLLVDAETRVACIDAKTHRPQRLPPFITNALSAKEST